MNLLNVHEGQWYLDRASHDVFCVIGVDEIEGLIDIRDGYGDVDEFDLDEWQSMDLELCAAPSGWSTAFDEFDDDSAAYPGSDPGPHETNDLPDRATSRK